MKCREALVAMLGADPPELAGRGDSPVAEHVRGCARCAAVAGRLMSESRLLASAVAWHESAVRSAPRRVVWRPLGAFTGTLAVAALVLAVIVVRRPVDRSPVNIERSAAQAVVVAPPAPAPVPVEKSNSSATVRRRPRAEPRAMLMGSKRYEAVPIRAVTSVAATPMATVAVKPSAGHRAAVIRTSNPSVTVVWIY